MTTLLVPSATFGLGTLWPCSQNSFGQADSFETDSMDFIAKGPYLALKMFATLYTKTLLQISGAISFPSYERENAWKP